MHYLSILFEPIVVHLKSLGCSLNLNNLDCNRGRLLSKGFITLNSYIEYFFTEIDAYSFMIEISSDLKFCLNASINFCVNNKSNFSSGIYYYKMITSYLTYNCNYKK